MMMYVHSTVVPREINETDAFRDLEVRLWTTDRCVPTLLYVVAA